MWGSDNLPLPLRRRRHIYSPYPRTSLLIHSSLARIPLAILRVHGATSVELPPRRSLLTDGDGQWGAKVRMVSFAENRTSRELLRFPMATASVLLDQICADGW